MEKMVSARFPDDERMMDLALDEARLAAQSGEVPVGAVVVAEGRVIAQAGNNLIRACDPVGHAEIRVLRQAAHRFANYRLPGTTLYVTLEPCAMCAAAMVNARVARLVFGATDQKMGGVVSQYTIGMDGRLNHTFSVTGGVRADICRRLLLDFFQKRR